jgi:hypothetical protein
MGFNAVVRLFADDPDHRRGISSQLRRFPASGAEGTCGDTRHGRRELVLMSADHCDWLTAAARPTHRTEDALRVVIEAVRGAEMDADHAHVDELMP